MISLLSPASGSKLFPQTSSSSAKSIISASASASSCRAQVDNPIRARARKASSTAKRRRHDSSELEFAAQEDNEFLLSLLQAGPSIRDSKKFLAHFNAPRPNVSTSTKTTGNSARTSATKDDASIAPNIAVPSSTSTSTSKSSRQLNNPLVADLLSHTTRRPALVKIQGPFSDVQLDSVAKGMAYLQKLGLVSVIVLDRDDLTPDESNGYFGLGNGSGSGSGSSIASMEMQKRRKKAAMRDLERTVAFLGKHRAPARPILATVIRSRSAKGKEPATDNDGNSSENEHGIEAFVEAEGLDHIRRAVDDGEIPVLIPIAVDEQCRSRMISGDEVIKALARAMVHNPKPLSLAKVEAGPEREGLDDVPSSSALTTTRPKSDLTPLRLLIINREGGIPSYARAGLPHLSVNLESEYDFIHSHFLPAWKTTHPSALQNLTLAKECLEIMPANGSALVVSHKSPAALIANLITNKPAFSASLPHSLLIEGRVTPHTPTLIRKGLPIKIIRSLEGVDRVKLTSLLERSFRRVLDQEAFYSRLESDLDFLIVAGDYVGAALCTNERPNIFRVGNTKKERDGSICYLDKFAVLPSHQGDGTVDFLWVALRDETFGLGLTDAANANEGSLSGIGRGRDLVWRSRADNPVNKWYYERSNGFVTRGKWKLFWCDAEERMRRLTEQRKVEMTGRDEKVELRTIERDEHGRLDFWGEVVESIPSAWSD